MDEHLLRHDTQMAMEMAQQLPRDMARVERILRAAKHFSEYLTLERPVPGTRAEPEPIRLPEGVTSNVVRFAVGFCATALAVKMAAIAPLTSLVDSLTG